MKKLFDNAEKRRIFLLELNSWLGTPYGHWGTEKQKAADCSLFILEIFKSLNLINNVNIPYQSRIWSRFGKEEVLLNQIEDIRKHGIPQRYCLLNIYEKNFIVGDILTFTLNSDLTNHLAVCKNKDVIIESTETLGVHEALLKERIKNLNKIYRFYER